MGKLIIQNATVVDPFSNTRTTKNIEAAVLGEDITLDGEGLYVFPSFVDVHVHFRDPGFLEKESLETGAAAALHGGFSHIVCMANTKPVMMGEEITRFYKRAEALPIHAYTVSALTVDLKGEELVDMDDAARRGAIGFSDDGLPLKNIQVLEEAFRRAKALDLPISLHEEDPDYVFDAGIDSRYAPAFDLKGAEAMAEYSLSARDLALAFSIGAKLDIQHISCALTARIVAAFAASGGNVLGELTPHHLTMAGEDVAIFKTMAKMNPPLRTKEDAEGLRKFVGDPHFAIATDHAPHTAEEKARDFKEAPSGIVGLETAFPLLFTTLVLEDKVELMDLIDAMTRIPAEFYKLPHKGIDGGDFVLFDPEGETVVDENFFHGKSTNSPLIGRRLKGKILAICTKETYHTLS